MATLKLSEVTARLVFPLSLIMKNMPIARETRMERSISTTIALKIRVGVTTLPSAINSPQVYT